MFGQRDSIESPISANKENPLEKMNSLSPCDLHEQDFRAIAEELWKILDDISTASDRFKPTDEKTYKMFYDYTIRKIEERSKYFNSIDDGQTLVTPSEEKYNIDFERRIKLLEEFENATAQQVKAVISHQTKDMTEEEQNKYLFKWSALVRQEIDMWVRINKPVYIEEFDFICERRGFTKAMRNYLTSALEYVQLKGF